MITKIVMGLIALLWILGLIIMLVELVGCETGYEDEKGFHYGKDPANKR